MRHFYRDYVTPFVFIVLLSIASSLVAPHFAHAAVCDGVKTVVIDCSNSSDTTGNAAVAVLAIAIQILTGLVGIAAVAAFIYAGITYASANGESAQVKKAKDLMRNTVIGLVIFALMGVALDFFIPGGIFSNNTSFTAADATTGPPPAQTNDKSLTVTNPDNDDSVSSTPVQTVTDGECYWNHSAGYPKGNMFHIDNTKKATVHNSYAFEDSPEGVRYAKSKGYPRIDIDIQTTKDGVVVATHSTNPFMKKLDGTWGGFYDPSGKIKSGSIQSLTWAQVSKLRHKVGGYQIHTLQDIINTAKEVGITLNIEFKTPLTLKSKIPYITSMINTAHIKASFIGITDKSGQTAALKEAREHGFWGRYLWAHDSKAPIKTSTCK